MANEEKFYKTAEVETILAISKSTLKRWIKSGKIRAVKFGPNVEGNPWHISEAELERVKAKMIEPHYNVGTEE
jgi:excisionase family DNA binding protein